MSLKGSKATEKVARGQKPYDLGFFFARPGASRWSADGEMPAHKFLDIQKHDKSSDKTYVWRFLAVSTGVSLQST